MQKLPNRKSNRLKGYDYSRNGLYFITIICQDREERFGEIISGEMILNDAGRMVLSEWAALPRRFTNLEIDLFVIMPNHIHGVLILDDENGNVGTPLVGVRDQHKMPNQNKGGQGQAQSLQCNGYNSKWTVSDIIGAFKSITTNRYINGVKMGLLEPFRKHLWQGRFYDHIIRNEKEYMAIEQYILTNPLNWENDRLRKRVGLMEECAVYEVDGLYYL